MGVVGEEEEEEGEGRMGRGWIFRSRLGGLGRSIKRMVMIKVVVVVVVVVKCGGAGG